MDELTAIRDAFPAAPDPDAAMLARAQLRLDAVIRADRGGMRRGARLRWRPPRSRSSWRASQPLPSRPASSTAT